MKEQILLLDETTYPILMEAECEKLKPIISEFIKAYVENSDKPIESWLNIKLQEILSEMSKDEIDKMSADIISAIKQADESKKDLTEAMNNGRSIENWFAAQTKKALSLMSAQEASAYLTDLDATLKNANDSFHNTITTQLGKINQNPCLDGFIAEQHHAQTFNINAEAVGSEYRAKVLEPIDGKYTKNSVDIVIVDGNGKIVRRYQSKYCKNAKATQKAFEQGDYRGQQKLVPDGQQQDISYKTTTVIEIDGVTSTPLSKMSAEQLRDEAQSGKWNDLNWNEYKAKDLAIGIGKQVGYSALQGAAIGVGIEVAEKIWRNEEIKGEEVVEVAFTTGADFGIKAATAGAIKVGVEKGIITVIPKGTPASTITNIAFIAVENAKTVKRISDGELSLREGMDEIEKTTISCAGGMIAMGKGALIGTQIGLVLGPVGGAVGGFVGGTIGYFAGSKIGEQVVRGMRRVREIQQKMAETFNEEIKKDINKVKERIKGIVFR